MKKLSCRHKKFLTRKSFSAPIHKKIRYIKRKCGYNNINRHSAEQLEALSRKYGAKKHLPEVMCFDSNYEETARFLQGLREDVRVGVKAKKRAKATREYYHTNVDRLGYVDFSTANYISPTAALVLAAEYHRSKLLLGLKSYVVDMKKWNREVYSMLRDVGFLELLRVQNIEQKSQELNFDINVIKFMSGKKVEGDKIDELISLIRNQFSIKEDDSFLYLYDSVVEAMTNVIHHAYPIGEKYEIPIVKDRWWMTGFCLPDKSYFGLTFYDQGVSIPGSLPRSRMWEHIRRFLLTISGASSKGGDADDGDMIMAAMQSSRSRTREAGRGNGLVQMKDLIDTVGGGRLRILSRRGEYVYVYGGEENAVTRNVSVGGTLIEWEIWPRPQ